MKLNLAAIVLIASVALSCDTSFGCELLDRMLGRAGCSSCQAPKAPSCGCGGGLMDKLVSKSAGCGCGGSDMLTYDANMSCGPVASPCGCDAAPAADCGCGAPAAPACGGGCGLMSKLRGSVGNGGCGCGSPAPVADCGCSAPAPAPVADCGCEAPAAPACGGGCGLMGKLRGSVGGCGSPAPVADCGCSAPAPVADCGCSAPAPVSDCGCSAPAPVADCGCGAPAAPAFGGGCGVAKKPCSLGLFSKLKSGGCGSPAPAADCGCSAPAPVFAPAPVSDCGCGAAKKPCSLGLFSKLKSGGCGSPAPVADCGCSAPAVSDCGCSAPVLSGGCGSEVAQCGCNSGVRGKLSLLDRLRGNRIPRTREGVVIGSECNDGCNPPCPAEPSADCGCAAPVYQAAPCTSCGGGEVIYGNAQPVDTGCSTCGTSQGQVIYSDDVAAPVTAMDSAEATNVAPAVPEADTNSTEGVIESGVDAIEEASPVVDPGAFIPRRSNTVGS